METTIHTLQDYMLHTESITYIIIVAALSGITFFYRFLTDRDDDEKWLRMNIEHRTSNIECWMEKDEETEELIKIFVTSIKTAEKKQK